MEALYVALLAALCNLNTAATVWTLAVPLVVTSFALMLGNWCAAPAQLMLLHPAMIDPNYFTAAGVWTDSLCLSVECCFLSHKLDHTHCFAVLGHR